MSTDIKTKEEILNKHDSSHKYIEQTCRPELFAAMEEYAKQQARLFMLEYNGGNDDRFNVRYDWFLKGQQKKG